MSLKSKLQKVNMLTKMPKGFISLGLARLYRFYKHSSAALDNSNVRELCRDMRITSHAIEKGLALPVVKKGFGKEKINKLLSLMDKYIAIGDYSYDAEAYEMAYGIISCYCDNADQYDCDISFIDLSKYAKFISHTDKKEYGAFETEQYSISERQQWSFSQIAHNRHSIRTFEDEPVDKNTIDSVIELAQTAPSACNRQATRIIHVSDREKCRKILDLQGGSKGHSISELLLVASDLSLYRFISEVGTPFLDSGIYLMNLLYSCEYYGVSTCPLIWDDFGQKAEELRTIIDIPWEYNVTAVVQIGFAPKGAVYAKSKRRNARTVIIEK